MNLNFYVRMLGVKTFKWQTALLNSDTDKTARFLFQVGEGEKLVRALFAVARELQPSIIFIGKKTLVFLSLII